MGVAKTPTPLQFTRIKDSISTIDSEIYDRPNGYSLSSTSKYDARQHKHKKNQNSKQPTDEIEEQLPIRVTKDNLVWPGTKPGVKVKNGIVLPELLPQSTTVSQQTAELSKKSKSKPKLNPYKKPAIQVFNTSVISEILRPQSRAKSSKPANSVTNTDRVKSSHPQPSTPAGAKTNRPDTSGSVSNQIFVGVDVSKAHPNKNHVIKNNNPRRRKPDQPPATKPQHKEHQQPNRPISPSHSVSTIDTTSTTILENIQSYHTELTSESGTQQPLRHSIHGDAHFHDRHHRPSFFSRSLPVKASFSKPYPYPDRHANNEPTIITEADILKQQQYHNQHPTAKSSVGSTVLANTTTNHIAHFKQKQLIESEIDKLVRKQKEISRLKDLFKKPLDVPASVVSRKSMDASVPSVLQGDGFVGPLMARASMVHEAIQEKEEAERVAVRKSFAEGALPSALRRKQQLISRMSLSEDHLQSRLPKVLIDIDSWELLARASNGTRDNFDIDSTQGTVDSASRRTSHVVHETKLNKKKVDEGVNGLEEMELKLRIAQLTTTSHAISSEIDEILTRYDAKTKDAFRKKKKRHDEKTAAIEKAIHELFEKRGGVRANEKRMQVQFQKYLEFDKRKDGLVFLETVDREYYPLTEKAATH